MKKIFLSILFSISSISYALTPPIAPVIFDSACSTGIYNLPAQMCLPRSPTTSIPLVTSDGQSPNLTMPAYITTFFGDGSDGTVSLSSGTTTLTRDMFYSNLTISGSAVIKTNGFRIFVLNTLDITAAGVGAFTVTGGAGNIGGGGGSVGPVNGGQPGTKAYNQVSALGLPTGGGAGGTGNTGAGGAGTNSNCNGFSNGGNTENGGVGGAGSSGAGGTNGANNNTVPFLIHRPEIQLIMGTQIYNGGCSGCGGGGAGGNGLLTYGSGGGGGGAGAGVMYVSAYTINRGGSTAAGTFGLLGGVAGAGGAGGAAGSGGGGGGSGGGGGWLFMMYGTLSGSTATNAIDLSGGAGGAGGNAGSGATGGHGGGSGFTGRITFINIANGTVSEVIPIAGTNGSAASGTTGGTGASQNTKQVNL